MKITGEKTKKTAESGKTAKVNITEVMKSGNDYGQKTTERVTKDTERTCALEDKRSIDGVNPGDRVMADEIRDNADKMKMKSENGFPAPEPADRLFALIFTVLGYGFIHTIFSIGTGRSLAVYTVCYAAAVLLYLRARGSRPAAESRFWLAVMLALGISYNFRTVMPFIQVIALIVTAAYWTFCASGRLLGGGKTSRWIFFDGWNALAAVPFGNFTCLVRVLLSGNRKRPGDRKKIRSSRFAGILLGALIAVPLLLIVAPLLAGADPGFEHILTGLTELIDTAGEYFLNNFSEIFFKFILSIPVSFYLFGLAFGSFHGRGTERVNKQAITEAGKSIKRLPDTASCTALAILSLVYIIFIALQGGYLFSAFAGTLPDEFTYAEYARRGFFELCGIGLWNLIFLTLAEMFSRTPSRSNKYLRFFTVFLSILTLLLIATAVSRLGMYMSVYGLTVKRVMATVFLVWLALVFAAVIARQYRRFPAVRFCIMAGAVLFCMLCVFPVESWTAAYNEWAVTRGMISV